MADAAVQSKKINVPAGSHFILGWRVPNNCQINVTVQKGGADSVISSPKNKNGKSASYTVTVTKDGTAIDYDGPQFKESTSYAGGGTNRRFSAVMAPANLGEYVYTVTAVIPEGTKLPANVVTSLTETVEVTKADPLNDKRKSMVDLIEKWMPTSVKGKAYPVKTNPGPDGKDTDLLSLAGWKDGGQGDKSVLVKDENTRILKEWTDKKAQFDKDVAANNPDRVDPGHKPIPGAGLTPLVTSCGDVLNQMLKLWGCDFMGDGKMESRAFGISVDDKQNKKKGARSMGYYVDALEAFKGDKPQFPKPGDILVLRQGTPGKAPYRPLADLAHVCIIVSISDDIWCTADGGGGALPDQTAGKSDKQLGWTAPSDGYPKGIACVGSVTDNMLKMVDGWVDLDKVPNPKFDKDGKAISK
jgi:hypothetical protein